MSAGLVWAACAAGAYLVGSVPFGLLIGRARGIDIRRHGSKNIGATNVGRVLGRKWGFLCFALDMLKGALPVLGAGWLTGALGRVPLGASEAGMWIGVAVSAILGHVFPVFLRFKGGKGVATGFGALAAIWPHMTIPALVALAAWLIVLRLSRYVSLSSCVASATLPLSGSLMMMSGWASPWPFAALGAALCGFVLWTHRANIARLRSGTELKVGRARA